MITPMMEAPMAISAEIMSAAARGPPSRAKLLAEDQPAIITPYTPSERMAKTYRVPTFRVTGCSGISRPARCRVSPNGIDAKAASAKKTETKGASVNRKRSARAGRKSSLVSILMASASGWKSPMSRSPKMEARLAPMRSCMIADCLRSTQVSRPPTFSTNSMTKATRPNAIPRSITRRGATPPFRTLPLSIARAQPALEQRSSSCARGLSSRAYQLAGVADGLVGHPGNGRDRSAQLVDPVLGACGQGRLPERGEDASQDLPIGEGLAQLVDGRPEPLHASLEVREGAVPFHPGRRRQDPAGQRAGRVGVGAAPDERLHRPQGRARLRLRPSGVEQIVAEDPQTPDPARAGGGQDRRGVAAQADQLGAARVRVLVGPDQELVLVARHPRPHREADLGDAAAIQHPAEREEVLVGHLRRGDDAGLGGRMGRERPGDPGDRLVPGNPPPLAAPPPGPPGGGGAPLPA